jgi:hypothetical protein
MRTDVFGLYVVDHELGVRVLLGSLVDLVDRDWAERVVALSLIQSIGLFVGVQRLRLE